MEYDCIIIGSGVGGLVSACELVSKGKKVLVLEKQPIPGGLATSFKRRGFTFESVLHIVDTLSGDGEVKKLLDDWGVSEKINYIDMHEFGRIIYPGHDFVVNADFDNLKEILIKDFPHEERGIKAFFCQLKIFYSQFDNFSDSNFPMWFKLALSPILYPGIIKTSCMTVEQFISQKIKDKLLRSIIGTLWGFIGLPPSELCAFYFLIVFRGFWGVKTAYVKGGFAKIFNAMVGKIRDAGSEVRFNTVVNSIITDNGKAVRGVATDKGEEFKAKVVISNANAIDTLTKIIDTGYLRDYYNKLFSSMRKSISALTVYLGLDISAKKLGMNSALFSINAIYDHDESFKFSLQGEYGLCSLAVVDHSQLDPELAPEGKGTITIMSLDSYTNWQGLSEDEYKKKKKDVADIIIARMEKFFPGLSKHLEVVEVATPRTMERFGTLPEGAIYGFAQTVPQASINRLSQKTKIRGLFLAGAWTRPGCGVHGCFVSGKDAADLALGFLKV